MKSVYITFKYNTDKEKINVENVKTLLNSLIKYTEMLEEICKGLGTCEELDIYVENVKKGSIEVNFVVNFTANIDIINVFLVLILTMKTLLEQRKLDKESVKKEIKAELEKEIKKEIDEKIIERITGKVIKMLKYIKEDKDIQGFEIIPYEDKERKKLKYEKVEITREELELLLEELLLEEENQEIDPNEERDWGMGPGR